MFSANNNISTELIFAVPQDDVHIRTWGGKTYLMHADEGENMTCSHTSLLSHHSLVSASLTASKATETGSLRPPKSAIHPTNRPSNDEERQRPVTEGDVEIRADRSGARNVVVRSDGDPARVNDLYVAHGVRGFP